jgi:hypothetical protein
MGDIDLSSWGGMTHQLKLSSLFLPKEIAIPDFFQEFLINFIQRKFQNSKFLV